MSDGPKYRDEEWLREQYVKKSRTTYDIADECGCSDFTVSDWLNRHSIETRAGGWATPQQLKDKQWLRKQYVDEGRTTYDIAEECGCVNGTVSDWLRRHNIKTRPGGDSIADVRLADAEWLREQYVNRNKTLQQVAGRCGCSGATVRKWLKQHDIDRREGGHGLPDARLTDGEWLIREYSDKKRTLRDIADQLGCSHRTVGRWIEKHGADTRRGGDSETPEKLTDEEWLKREYVDKKRSSAEIAKECGCAGNTVLRWLKKYNIETRRGGDSETPEKLTDEEWLKREYVGKKNSKTDIASKCGCSGPTVSKWMEVHGIESRELAGKNHPNWGGGKKPYGPGWNDSKRRQVRDRDGHRCRDCGTTQAEHKAEYDQKLHVHHLIKARDIDDPEERNAMENLITLCQSCHQEWERLSEAGIRPQIDGVTAD